MNSALACSLVGDERRRYVMCHANHVVAQYPRNRHRELALHASYLRYTLATWLIDEHSHHDINFTRQYAREIFQWL